MNKEKEQLKRMDPRRIIPSGKYILRDREGTIISMTTLSMEDIRYLRWYHQDNQIAYEVNVPVRKKTNATKKTGTSGKKKCKLTRDPKYSESKFKLKEPIATWGRNFLIFGLVVCIGAGAAKFAFTPTKNEPSVGGAYVTTTDGIDYTSGSGYMDSPTLPEEEIDQDYAHQIERAEFIKLLCQVFQVDYQTTYSKLVEMTDDFCDSEYLAGRHPLVSCKGMAIDADTEEEFLIYAVRVIAQDPGRVDLTSDEVCIDNGYDSGTEYVELIAKWSKHLNVDPALVYGIMRAETGFSSELFIECHNPGGLKSGNGFWVFPNKEAGIIELMMEIIKYQYKGANTIEEMARIHCPINDPDDVNGLNKNWVKNVTDGYEKGREIFEEMGYYKNNGLSH